MTKYLSANCHLFMLYTDFTLSHWNECHFISSFQHSGLVRRMCLIISTFHLGIYKDFAIFNGEISFGYGVFLEMTSDLMDICPLYYFTGLLRLIHNLGSGRKSYLMAVHTPLYI